MMAGSNPASNSFPQMDSIECVPSSSGHKILKTALACWPNPFCTSAKCSPSGGNPSFARWYARVIEGGSLLSKRIQDHRFGVRDLKIEVDDNAAGGTDIAAS